MSVLLFFIILALLILVHEFGHFIIAKKSGIRVDEFGLGFPPKLFGKKIGETEYTLNLIPFGGFVKIFGETPDEASLTGTDSARSLVRKPRLIQAAVISGGVLFNVLFAWLLISAGFMVGLPTSVENAPIGARIVDEHLAIIGVEQGSPAAEAGLKPGDRILSLRAGEDALSDPTASAVRDFTAERGAQEIELFIRRGETVVSARVTPVTGIVEGRTAIGIGMDRVGIVSLPPHRALIHGVEATWSLTVATAGALWGILAGLFEGNARLSDLTGPVGIVGVVGDAAQVGFAYLVSLTALISINLAIINILPIPALDGGRLLFIIVEAITRRPVNTRFANAAHTIGFVLLIGLMLLITYHDIIKLIH